MKKAKIEVFKAGVYGDSEGRIWSQTEVQELQENYDSSYRNAPVILGHNEWSGEKPAYGWAESFEVDENGVLLANIEYNDELGGMIKNKMYTRVSIEATKKIELYDRVEGKTGAYVLAIALLGGSQPAVSGLKPVSFTKEDKINGESLENDIEAFNVTGDDGDDEEHFENEKDATVVISDTIVDEVDDNSTQTKKEEYNVTKEELEKFEADKKAFAIKQEEAKNEADALAKEKDDFALVGKKADVSKFVSDNSKRIVPAIVEKVESFMVGLSDEQTESFKEIIAGYPENEIFKKMEDEKNKDEHIDTDAKFEAQAKADIESAKK